MSTSESNPQTEPLAQPIEYYPDGLVRHVYEKPGTDNIPDLASQDEMGWYLMERMEQDLGPQDRIIWTETGRTRRHLERPIVDYRHTTKLERDGWIIPPRIAAAVWIGSLAASIAAPAVQDGWDEVKGLTHAIYREFEPVRDRTVLIPQTQEVHGPLQHIKVNADAANLPGSTLIDQPALKKFETEVKGALGTESKLVSITVTGRSSDEYGTNASIGRAEPPAEDFAGKRAEAYAAALRDVALAAKNVPITTKVDQNVLTKTEKAEVEQAAAAAGFTGPNNIVDAIHSVEAGDPAPASLKSLIDRLFTSKRGVELDAAVTTPGKTSTRTVYVKDIVPGKDNPPSNPNRDYDPWLIPLPPIARLRRAAGKVKPVRRLKLSEPQPVYGRSILHEETDQVWLRIRPEAVREDQTLIETPWAYTRKYEYLMRDDRIAEVLKADFKKMDGEEKSLRIMFVDKAPDDITVQAFSELLAKFAAMDNGKIADRVSGIFVYPSESAGTMHRDPRRIAMGIDKQSPSNVLGTYTYALDLVEMHMPTNISSDDLAAWFKQIEGPSWTLAHEVAGHATDDSDADLKLQPIRTSGIANAHLMSGDPRARKMSRLHRVLRNLPMRRLEKTSPIMFDITYPVVDNKGNIVTQKTTVEEGDPRLDHATVATIAGSKPTRYASSSETEHYAETAASVTTGIAIPYDEAEVTVQALTADNGAPADFAEGYRPDQRAQDLFTKSVGGKRGSFPIVLKLPEMTMTRLLPEDDPLLRREMQRARKHATPTPEEMIAILARVSRHEHKGHSAER